MAAHRMKRTIWLRIKASFYDLVIWRSVICCGILEEYRCGVWVACQLVTDTDTPSEKRLRRVAKMLLFYIKSAVNLLSFRHDFCQTLPYIISSSARLKQTWVTISYFNSR